MQKPSNEDQKHKLDLLKEEFCKPRVLQGSGSEFQPLLSYQKLREQYTVYKFVADKQATILQQKLDDEREKEAVRQQQIAEQHAAEKARHTVEAKPEQLPVITRFWQAIADTGSLAGFSEWAKAAELVIAMVPGSVEEERCFSAMNFLKNEQRNRLTAHLEACIRIFCQQYYDISTFPYEEAYHKWLVEKDRKHLS